MVINKRQISRRYNGFKDNKSRKYIDASFFNPKLLIFFKKES